MIHSREDDIIPNAEGEQLFAHAREPKRFLEIHGGHGNGWMVSREVYTRGIEDFLKSHVATHPTDRPNLSL